MSTIRTILVDSTVQFDEVVLLLYKIQYPNARSSEYPASSACINRFYETDAFLYQEYLQRDLFHQAAVRYQDSPGDSPVNAYEADSRYQITLNSFPLLSLFTDRYEYTGGAHGATIRRSETWCLPQCRRLALSELFPVGFDYMSYIFAEIASQIKRDPEQYFEDPLANMVNTFRAENFYCIPGGFTIYYQQYDIAPYSGGIREFPIPYPGVEALDCQIFF